MAKFIISIGGMGCANCVKSVSNALKNIGADIESCEIGKAVASCECGEDAIKNAVEDIGFEVLSIARV